MRNKQKGTPPWPTLSEDAYLELACKRFWLWCFLNKDKIDALTGYYNINERVNMIYKLYKKETE